jgi:hypothetical protein
VGGLRKRLQQEHVPVSFQEVTRALGIFLGPIAASISEESKISESMACLGSMVLKSTHFSLSLR